jgi:hypothetical protein
VFRCDVVLISAAMRPVHFPSVDRRS